jgi:putative glutamine transport system substrate-binding protein
MVASLLLSLSTAHAGNRLAEIRARGTLVVSVKNDAKHPHKDPAHFDKRGFEVELVHALARSIVGDANKVELKMLSRPVRLPILASGGVDLVVSMIPVSDDNKKLCDFSHPYFVSGMSLLVRDGGKRLTLADLDGKTVAFRKQSFNDHGGELQRIAKAHGVAVTVEYFRSFDEAVAAVRRGEAVAMGGNFVDLDAWQKAHKGFVVDTTLLEERAVAVGVKKGEPELLDAVNRAIDALKRSGELERMTLKWHLPYLLPAG